MNRKSANDHPERSPCSDMKIRPINDLWALTGGGGWLMGVKLVGSGVASLFLAGATLFCLSILSRLFHVW